MTPDRWLAVVVAVPNPDAGDLLAAELVHRGARAVEERADGLLVTHFPPPDDVSAFLDSLGGALDAATGTTVGLCWHWQPHEEWAEHWKRGLEPTRVSRRVTVAPTWDIPPDLDGGVLVAVDPGMAFGTARHASTRCALRLVDAAIRPGVHLADVGTGSGILAIAAAKLGAARVLAVDSDPYACDAARENVVANGVHEVVRIHDEQVSSEWLAARRPFDGIAANIESGVLVSLLPGFAAALPTSGWLVVSGLLAEESDDFANQAASRGFVLTDDDAEDGWWAGTFRLTAAGRVRQETARPEPGGARARGGAP